MTEHPSGCRDTLHVHRGFRAPGSLIHELSRVSASCVCCAGRCWTVLKSRGRDARLVAPGAPRSEGRRWRGVPAINGSCRPQRDSIPDAKGPALAISPEPALAVQALVHDNAHATSSALARPAGRPRSGAGTAQ